MQKARRNPELRPVFSRQLCSYPLTIGRGTCAGIHSDVPDRATCYTNQLSLLIGGKLAVKSTNNAFFAGQALIVLNERKVDTRFCHTIEIVGLRKEPPVVTKAWWSDENDVWNGETFNLHDEFLFINDVRERRQNREGTEKTLSGKFRQRFGHPVQEAWSASSSRRRPSSVLPIFFAWARSWSALMNLLRNATSAGEPTSMP